MSRAEKVRFTRPHRILVVDDEPDLERLMRQRMRRDVRKGRFRLTFAQNGVEALDCLRSDGPFDMVLSDINMPQMDGLTLLQQIPSVDPDVRAVIVSAYGDMRNIRTAMNRGAFDFVTKPIDFRDLRVTIDRSLKNLAQWREALASRDRLVALENELSVARRMQRSILPTMFPKKRNCEVFASMQAARAVGGDFYDVVSLEEEYIGLAIADVSGKGVPAALFMMSSRTLLKGAAIGTLEPAAVLTETNNILSDDNASMMFVTVLYAIYNAETGRFLYASGGHDTPLVVHPDGSSTFLSRTNGVALGVIPEFEYVAESVLLKPGDTVLLYTDGVTEAQNAEGEQFGLGRLSRLFDGAPPRGAQEATERVFNAVKAFAGDAEQFDDITCLAMQRTGKL